MKWGDTEWKQLSGGRMVNVPKGCDVCVVSVFFADPRERPRDFPLALDGRVVDHVEIDGERFVRSRYDESCEVVE